MVPELSEIKSLVEYPLLPKFIMNNSNQSMEILNDEDGGVHPIKIVVWNV